MDKQRLLIALTEEELRRFFPPDLRKELSRIGYEIREREPTADGWEKFLLDFQPEVVMGAWILPPIPLSCLFSNGGSVKYLCYITGTVRRKVTREMVAEGLLVTNWGDVIGKYVAEYTLMLILCALRRTMRYGIDLKIHSKWREKRTENRSLFNLRVGLHGFGSIARALVPLLKPFNVEISAHTGVPHEMLEKYEVKRVATEEELFSNSDVLVELKPLTGKTEKTVTEDLLRLLPKDACFVNVGRGLVVDEEALCRVAREERIQVALDVYAVEPLPMESPLRELPNVTLLPHMGGATVDRDRACGESALGNLQNYFNNRPLAHSVAMDNYDRAT